MSASTTKRFREAGSTKSEPSSAEEMSEEAQDETLASPVDPDIPDLDTNILQNSYNLQIAHPTTDEPSDDEAPEMNPSETGIPNIGNFGPQDTRFGGEDLSGMSEWSMRATSLELDDGLDAGDFKRPDNEIARDAAEAFARQLTEPGEIQFSVRGGEITIEGWTSSREQIEKIETTAQDVPGVKEVHNSVVLQQGSGKNMA